MSAEKQEPLSAAEFGRLFMTYRARFEVIARRYVRSDAVAEDIVSDSFMAFWESSARISPPPRRRGVSGLYPDDRAEPVPRLAAGAEPAFEA